MKRNKFIHTHFVSNIKFLKFKKRSYFRLFVKHKNNCVNINLLHILTKTGNGGHAIACLRKDFLSFSSFSFKFLSNTCDTSAP